MPAIWVKAAAQEFELTINCVMRAARSWRITPNPKRHPVMA